VEERNKIVAWVPHKSKSETMVYGGDVYLRVWETPVQSLGQEGLLEEGIATHPSTLNWKIPRTEA